MAFRIIDPFFQSFLDDGRVNDGGSISTYLNDTETPAPTYSDPELTTSNGNTVTLDAYGRPLFDMWAAAPMSVEVKTSLGAIIKTRDDVPGAIDEENQPLPTTGNPNDFLMWDGTEWIPEPIIQVPDPTGLSNYQLVSDGTGVPVWQQIEEPDIPVPEYDVETGFIRIGTLLDQWGTAIIPAAPGAQTASVNVTFAEEFSGTPYHCSPTITNAGGSTASGRIASLAVTNLTATGCTITANVGEDDTRSDFKLTNTTPVSYRVVGPTTEPEA